MIRRLKVFGIALMATTALGAFGAQGASAVPITVEPPTTSPVFITGAGETKYVFKTSGTIDCTTASYSSKATPVSGAISELTLTPSYSGCVAFGFATIDWKVNGCTYTTTTPTDIGVGVVTWHGSQVHLLCSAGKKMELTPTTFGASVCTQFFGEQTPTGGHIVARNVAGSSPMHITDEITIEGTHYTGTGGACGTSGTNGSITNNTTVKCFSDEAHTKQIGCTVS